MHALDLLLTAPASRPCEACRHARLLALQVPVADLLLKLVKAIV
jgi:hypothetical protein